MKWSVTTKQVALLLAVGGLAMLLCSSAIARPVSKQEAQRQADESLARSKQAYGFDAWPGKSGAVRPGVNIALALGARLPGLELASAAARPAKTETAVGNEGRIRWKLAGEEGPFEIRIWVLSSCADAQETMIQRLTFRANTAIEPRGSEMDLELGDVSFPGTKRTSFVRNNIVVEVQDPAGDALELAQLIDQAILARPAFNSYAQTAAYRPRINTLRFRDSMAQPLDLKGRVHSAARLPLVVDAIDPEGGPVYLSWSGTPGMSVLEAKDSTKGYTHLLSVELFTTDRAVQDRQVVLMAVNECGLFSTAILPLRITVTVGARTWADGTLVEE